MLIFFYFYQSDRTRARARASRPRARLSQLGSVGRPPDTAAQLDPPPPPFAGDGRGGTHRTRRGRHLDRRRTASAMTSRALAVDALIAGGDPLQRSSAAPRHRPINFLGLFGGGFVRQHRTTRTTLFPPFPRTAVHRVPGDELAGLLTVGSSATHAVAAPHTITPHVQHPHDTASLCDPLDLVAGASSPPTRSVSARF